MALPAPEQVFKHATETRSFDFDFTALLKLWSPIDTFVIGGVTEEHDVGIEIVSMAKVLTYKVRVFMRAGFGGSSYLVAVNITTAGGRNYRLEKRVMVTGTELVWPEALGGGGSQQDYLDDEAVYGGGGATL